MGEGIDGTVPYGNLSSQSSFGVRMAFGNVSFSSTLVMVVVSYLQAT